MSPIGRIFSVINLVLAALFLGWASVNLATSQEWMVQFEEEEKQHQETRETLTAEVDGLQSQLNTAKDEMSLVSTDRDNHKRDSERVSGDLTKERNDGSQLRTSLDELANTQQALQDQLQTQTTLASQASAGQNDAERERDSAMQSQQDAETERSSVVADNGNLNNRIGDLEKELVMSAEMIDSLEIQLAQLQVLTGASLSDIIPQKMINGTVVQALYDIQPGLVAINRGKSDGVVRGYTWEISNGTQYKGQVRVENVRDDMCTCIILRTEPGQKIGQGDRADTVL